MNQLVASPPLAVHDRVRVSGGRVGEVIGFYRNDDDLVLIRFEDGESRPYARADVCLLIG